jgi:uncharacterized protein
MSSLGRKGECVMRLDDVDTSDVNAEDQGNLGGGGGFPMGGGGGFPVSGRMGCGTVVILLIAALVFGVNPSSLMGGGEPASQAPQAQTQQVGAGVCDGSKLRKQSCQVLALGNQTWAKQFQGGGYHAPGIVFYDQNGQSGCGAAQSAMGPFYCPADEKIYIDTAFYDELQQRFGAAGDFAQDYVIAHELGHHIQKLTGIADKVQNAQSRLSRTEGNRYQVAMELQADCYAGVWAALNKERMEPGDIEEGLRAAHQIGDDVLQKASQGVVVESAFTHGSAEQRMTWLKRGLQTGDPDQCDTFKG